MAEFKRIVQIGYEYLQQAIHPVRDIFAECGWGKGGVSFGDKVAELGEGKVPGSEMKQYDVLASTHYGLDVLM